MKTKRIFFGLFILLSGIAMGQLLASESLVIKMRFYQGTTEEKIQPPEFVTSSYLQPTTQTSIPSGHSVFDEERQLQDVFNLQSVGLITEADLSWDSTKKKALNMFVHNDHEYLVTIAPVGRLSKRHFKIEVFEKHKEGFSNLLETETTMTMKEFSVFGFEDRTGKPYFLSFQLQGGVQGGMVGGVEGGVIGGVQGGVEGGVIGGIIDESGEDDESFEEGAVRAVGDVKPPKLIKKVEPDYPEEAIKARIEGIVILNVRADEEGNVDKVKVLRGKDPLLITAAIDAVKQWKYNPMVIKGKPMPILFTVTVRFKLKERELKEDFTAGAVSLKDLDTPPRRTKYVEPVYPEDARKADIQGVVLLKVRTDRDGNVDAVKVIKSESTLLNEAAVEAVKQWAFEPYLKDGKATPVIFTVTVRFMLK